MKSLLVILLAAAANRVTGTWSILAINKRTNQIGSAMATCLDSDYYPEEARNFLNHGFSAVPFHGGIVAQANIQDGTGPAAVVGMPLLSDGRGADVVVSAMASPEADSGNITYQTSVGNVTYPLYQLRQYGVVTYNETSLVAAYTGPKLTPLYAGFGYTNTEETSLSSATDDYTVSVQGNIIYPNTVEATLDAFKESNATNFAERLFGALKQGFIETGGDVRCAYNPKLKGAVLSWLKVMEDDGTYSIDFEAEFGESQEMSALDSIEKQLHSWIEEESSVSANLTNSSHNNPSQSSEEEQSEFPSLSANQSMSTIELSETLFESVTNKSAHNEVSSQSFGEEQHQPSSHGDQLQGHLTIALWFSLFWGCWIGCN